MGMVPADIQVPTRAPTEMRIKIAGMPLAIFWEISSNISSQVQPTRTAMMAAMMATRISKGSVLYPSTPFPMVRITSMAIMGIIASRKVGARLARTFFSLVFFSCFM